MKKISKDEWRQADGISCPVAPETVVDVRFRDNVVWRSVDAGWFDEGASNWVHVGTHHDITHFQTVQS